MLGPGVPKLHKMTRLSFTVSKISCMLMYDYMTQNPPVNIVWDCYRFQGNEVNLMHGEHLSKLLGTISG